VLEDLKKKKKKMTIESRMRETFATHIDEKKDLEVHITQWEREWFIEGNKSELETNNVVEHLDQVIRKIQQAEETFVRLEVGRKYNSTNDGYCISL